MTNDLDRALIALRVSRDHGHGAVLNDAEVRALLAEIDRLREERELWRSEGLEQARLLGISGTTELRLRTEIDRLTRAIEKYEADDVRYLQETARLTRERDEARAERDEALGEIESFAIENDTLRHQVIACGVAATHPDANLTRTGAYAGKWNSAQAESVRKLRAERDALAKERLAKDAEAR